MKSNLPPLPRLDKDGIYSRWRLALDELGHGNTHVLIRQVRAVLARKLDRALLPKFDCSKFLKDTLVDVVDIGAAGGLHRRWAPFAGHVRGHLFEPEQKAYDELKKTQAKKPLIQVYPHALSGDGKPITIHITAWPRSSGVYLADPQHLEKVILKNHLKPVKTITMENTSTVDAVVDRADLIKIDVEGFELAILKGAERTLEQTVGLELEVSFYGRLIPDKPPFSEVDKFCRDHGFVLVRFFDMGDMDYILDDRRFDLGGTLYQADALYVRPPEAIISLVRQGKLPVESIWRSAVIYIAYRQLQLAWVMAEEASSLTLKGDDGDRLKLLISSLRHYAGVGRPLSRRTLHHGIELIGPLD